MNKKSLLEKKFKNYYLFGFLFLFIFSFTFVKYSEAAEKQINIGPLVTDTSKIIMGIPNSKVGIGGDPGSYNLNVVGTLNVTGAITSGASLASFINAANVSAGAFGSNTGGGNYSFPGRVTVGASSIYGPMNLKQDNTTNYGGIWLESQGSTRSIALAHDGSVGYLTTEYSTGGGPTPLELRTWGGQAFIRLNTDGNVGIGTTAPNSKLQTTGTLTINGGASGSVGNRLLVGTNSAPQTLEDTNLRPEIYISGAYPVLTLNHTVTSNGSHGPTIQFAHDGLNNRQFVIGTNGQGTQMDFGYSDGANNSNHNPHNGIANYQGTTIMRLQSDGNVGIGTTGPATKLDVSGTVSWSGGNSSHFGTGANVTTYQGNSSVNNALVRSNDNNNDAWIMNWGDSPAWGIYNRNIDSDLVVSGALTVPANSTAFIGGGLAKAYISHQTGNAGFMGTVTAGAFSGPMSGTLNAANISAGTFGANTSGGNYAFPASISLPGDVNSSAYVYANELYTRDNVYLGYMGGWLSNLLNQNVRTDASPTFNNNYLNGWLYNSGRLGIYNSTQGTHFYADSASVWRMSSNNGLMFNTSVAYDSAIAGYVYHDGSGFGMLNNQGNWMFYAPPNNANVYFPAWGNYISSAATHRAEGTNFIDYSWAMYDAYRGGWRTSNDLYVLHAESATSAGNSDTVDGYHASNLAMFQSNRDFGSGTLIQSDIDYSQADGEPFLLEITGNTYGNIIPVDLKVQGYIYANTIINAGGISNGLAVSGLVAFNYNGKLCFWFPRQGYWNGYSVFITDSYGGVKRNRLTSISDSGKPGGISKEVVIPNIVQSITTSNIGSQSVNYASTAGTAGTAGTLANSGAVSFTTDNSGFHVINAESTGSNVRLGSAWNRPGIYNGTNITIGSEDTIYMVTQNVERARINSGGNMYVANSVNAPYFYGSADIRLGDMWGGAGLYRPGGDMVFGTGNGSWQFSMGAVTRATIGTDGNIWMQWAGDWMSNILAGKASTGHTHTGYMDISANRLYDNYTGGAMYAYNGRIYNGWLGNSVAVSYADTANNVNNLAGTWGGLNYFLTNNGGSAVNNSNTAALEAYSTGNNSAFMSFHRGGYYAVNFGLDNDNVMRIGGWSAGANRWQLDLASGNETIPGSSNAQSFIYNSDVRLKQNINTIQNPLEKIMQLRGVTFNWKADNKTSVGLIAQEVEQVFPELVSTNTEGMKGVQYGNLVAPLIEAVKQQQTEISDQQRLIEELNARLKFLESKKK